MNHSGLLSDFDNSTNNMNGQRDSGFSPLQLSAALGSSKSSSSGVKGHSHHNQHQSSHSLLSPSPNILQTPIFKVPQDRDSPRPFGSEFDPCTSARTRGPESSTLWSLVAPSPTAFAALSPGLFSSPKLLTPLSATFPKFKPDSAHSVFGQTGAQSNDSTGNNNTNTTAQQSNSHHQNDNHNRQHQSADQHHPSHQPSNNSAMDQSQNYMSNNGNNRQKSTSSTQQQSSKMGCDTPTLKNIQMKMQQQKEQYRNNVNRSGVVAQSVDSVYGNMQQFQQNQLGQQHQQQQQQQQNNQIAPTENPQYTQNLARLCAQLSQHQDPQQVMNALASQQQQLGQQQQGGFPDPQPNDIQFHIKPARKNMDSFVSNTPRDLYSQPYKYDIRIVIPAHIRDHYVLKMQLCVEKTKQYIAKNHKNESTLIIERVIEKEHKGEAIFNYRVVFNACSFHFSKSLFSLHLFLVPKSRCNETDQTKIQNIDTSNYDPVWRSIPFEMYARKVNPRQWPTEKEIQERVQNYINDQTRSAQNFLGAPFSAMQQTLTALKTTADPTILSQVVNNAIQQRQQQMQPQIPQQFQQMSSNQQQMQLMSNFLAQQNMNKNISPPMNGSDSMNQSPSDGSPNARKNNKRKRNLSIDTQFSKRQKTGESSIV